MTDVSEHGAGEAERPGEGYTGGYPGWRTAGVPTVARPPARLRTRSGADPAAKTVDVRSGSA